MQDGLFFVNTGGKTALIVIAGGGITGLSAAAYLQGIGEKYILLERHQKVGGLCRSLKWKGYTFDWSGHLFCSQHPWVREWIAELLDGNLQWYERRACIYLEGVEIPFPFQAHIGFLPPHYGVECLADFLRQQARDEKGESSLDWPSWILRRFGEGMARLFFFPYHRKLWGVPLEELSEGDTEWSVPKPSVQEVINGTFGAVNNELGYNATFCYPTDGGIEAISSALSRDLKSIRRGSEIVKVFWREKVVLLRNNQKVSYTKLISTIPLSNLLEMLDPRMDFGFDIAPTPKAVSMWVINIGIRRPAASHYHWVYFPEEHFPFLRIGSYTAFASHLAPPGRSSFYVEVPYHLVPNLPAKAELQKVLSLMLHVGILHRLDEVEIVLPLRIPVAYVIHDTARKRWLPPVREALRSAGIITAGRYGAWGYGTMEHALIEGRSAAAGALEP